MDGSAFVAYIRDVLIPEIEPGTAVIRDNLATHRNKIAEAHLRHIAARSFSGMFEDLGEICKLYTPDECWNYFCDIGYAST